MKKVIFVPNQTVVMNRFTQRSNISYSHIEKLLPLLRKYDMSYGNSSISVTCNSSEEYHTVSNIIARSTGNEPMLVLGNIIGYGGECSFDWKAEYIKRYGKLD